MFFDLAVIFDFFLTCQLKFDRLFFFFPSLIRLFQHESFLIITTELCSFFKSKLEKKPHVTCLGKHLLQCSGIYKPKCEIVSFTLWTGILLSADCIKNTVLDTKGL